VVEPPSGISPIVYVVLENVMGAGCTRWKIGNERRATKIARGLQIKLTASDHVLEPTATVPTEDGSKVARRYYYEKARLGI